MNSISLVLWQFHIIMQHIWPYCFGKYKPLTPICAVFEGLVVSRLPKHHDQSMICFLAAINYHSLLNWACDHHLLPNYAGTVTDTVLYGLYESSSSCCVLWMCPKCHQQKKILHFVFPKICVYSCSAQSSTVILEG